MDLLGTHLQESARRAAGSFLSPLTNAIGEQRRLVESLAVVSKIRVEECKHMMVWSKAQTDDVGDILLKLNLLTRKISDYEIRFGTQYESFREKIKYLRTKDDSLCEMGRRQVDLQSKIMDASKSKLRSARAMLLQKELDDIQRQSAPTETKLQKLKREIIKGAYTEQLNAIVELGKKMQIIGEHGKQLIQHLDSPVLTKADARKTEDILQSARITLENWDKMVMVDPSTIVVHPSPERTMSDASINSINSVQTLPVPKTPAESESESGSDVEFVQAPTSPLKAKPSVVVTAAPESIPPKKPARSQEQQESVTAAHVQKEPETHVEEDAPEASIVAERVQEEDVETPKQEKHLSAFASTLAPKLTLTPSRPKVEAATPPPPTPPRSSDWASEATQALASVQGKKLHDILKEDDTSASEAETLRRLEELEIKQALELSLAEASKPAVTNESGDLQLTAEELRFVMGDIAPKRSTARRRARAPEATDDSTPVSSIRAASRRAKKGESGEKSKVSVDIESATSESHTDTESEQDVETPKASRPRVRGPQVIEPEGNRMSQQGPRPWMPEHEESESESSETSTVDLHGPEELASASHVAETMGEEPPTTKASSKNIKSTRASKVKESMGPEPERPLESMGPEPERPLESMGPEPERPLESMGPEPERPLESMGPEPERLLESMGDDGPDNNLNNGGNNGGNNMNRSTNQNDASVQIMPMPQMPSMEDIRQQKILMKQQQQLQHQQQQMAAYGVSPELQYLQLQNSMTQQPSGQGLHGQYGHPSPQMAHGSPQISTPGSVHSQLSYQAPSYRPSTAYVPSPSKQKNRLSGSHTPTHQGSPGSSPRMQHQQPYHQQQQQSSTYSPMYFQQQQQQQQDYHKQQQQQLQDFYYSPYEQEYQQQQYVMYHQQLREQRQHQRVDSVSSVSSAGSANIGIAPLGWSLPGMAPPQVTGEDLRQYQNQKQHHKRTDSNTGSLLGDDHVSSAAPSPSPSHISLITDHSDSPVMAPVAPLVPKKHTAGAVGVHPEQDPDSDNYKVEIK